MVSKNTYLVKEGAKKEVLGPFSKRDWYDMKPLAMSDIGHIGETLGTRIQGTKMASDGLKGHFFEVSFADLQNKKGAF